MVTDKGFLKMDTREKTGTHWGCSIIKARKTFYFDSFGGHPDVFLFKQQPNLIIFLK